MFDFSAICLTLSTGAILAIIRNAEDAFWKKTISMFSKEVKNRSYQKPADMWNIPISNLIYSDLKAQTTYCILTGLYEAIKISPASYTFGTNRKFTQVDYKEEIDHKVKLNPYNNQVLQFFKTRTPFFIVIEYAPRIFAHLRRIDNIEKHLILESLNPDNNISSLVNVHAKKGGSGSLFLFSEDQKYFMKTISRKERRYVVNELLVDYHNHIQIEKKSYLCRIYGIFTLKVPGLSPIELMLGQNLMIPGISRYYDLKGSSINRFTHQPDESFIGPFKDGDFITDKQELVMHPFIRDSMMETIYADVQFLLRHDIMDYSLLVFIVNKPTDYTELTPDAYNQEWYNIAIIDYLGKYDYKRKMEHYYKAVRVGRNIDMVSVVDPRRYAFRFLNFLQKFVLRTYMSIIESN